MGLTISITLPEPVEKYYKDEAIKQDVSRSKVIRNILVTYYEDKKKAEQMKFGRAPNKCSNRRRRDGGCLEFDIVCTARQSHAETCEKYTEED